jgi:hypothetical protein
MVTPARTPLRPDRLRALNLPCSADVGLDTWGRPMWVRESAGADGTEGERGETSNPPIAPALAGPGEEGGGTRRVEAVVDEWRIDDEWWRTPIHRRYVEVVLEGGAHVVLFEDVMTGEWYLQKP